METEHRDFYEKLRARVLGYAETPEGRVHSRKEYLFVVPDFFYLLANLVKDPRVSVGSKAKIAALIVYFISPVDLLPEVFLGPIGFLDDLTITVLTLNSVLAQIPQEAIEQHWKGPENVYHWLRKIMAMGDRILGRRIFNRIKKRAGKIV